MRIRNKEYLTFDDVLIVPNHSRVVSRDDIHLRDLHKNNPLCLTLPVISANMSTITGKHMAEMMGTLGGAGILHRYMPMEEVVNIISWWGEHREDKVYVSVGSITKDKERIDFLPYNYWYSRNPIDEYQFSICIDMAHGDSKNMIDTIKYIRNDKNFGGHIIAGNVCTASGASRLFAAGADVVKVGVGGGSVCTTREKTGCGYPQLEAIAECSKEGPIIADGGIRTPGDVCKALAAGAAYVMIGGMLAGTDCVPGWSTDDPTILYSGMASSRARARAGIRDAYEEGVSYEIPKLPVGSTRAVIRSIEDGIKSCMSYVGVSKLSDLPANAEFVRVSNNSKIEGTPHFGRNKV